VSTRRPFCARSCRSGMALTKLVAYIVHPLLAAGLILMLRRDHETEHLEHKIAHASE
jgi:hypothetical protein